jgi:hypothetical protein
VTARTGGSKKKGSGDATHCYGKRPRRLMPPRSVARGEKPFWGATFRVTWKASRQPSETLDADGREGAKAHNTRRRGAVARQFPPSLPPSLSLCRSLSRARVHGFLRHAPLSLRGPPLLLLVPPPAPVGGGDRRRRRGADARPGAAGGGAGPPGRDPGPATRRPRGGSAAPGDGVCQRRHDGRRSSVRPTLLR